MSKRKPKSKPSKRATAPRQPGKNFSADEAWVAKIARKSIQAIKPYVPGRSIEDVRAKYNVEQITKLGSNENPLGANPRVLRALHDALEKIALYPDGGSRNLRQALADAQGLTQDQVMVGNGSDEVLLLLTAAFLNPGEKVLVSENTFSEYEFSGRVLDGKIVKIPLREHRYDLAGFRRRLKLRPKMIFLCNPNNPTGTYFNHAELAGLLRAASPKTLVVVDEAYGDYAMAPDFPRSLELLRSHPNLVVSRTFSKIHGMAGLRLGYAFAHPLIIREAARVKTPFNVNLLAQLAAVEALSDRAFVEKSVENNVAGRRFLEEHLSALGLEFLPTQANFICFRVARPALDVCEDMLKRGVIARALASFGMDHWIRVTIGTPEQNQRFVAALQSVL